MTAGTIGCEQSRAGLKCEGRAAGVCDSGHKVATADIDGSHDCVVYWFDHKRRIVSATLCRQPMRSLSCSAQPAHVIISGLARLNAAQRRGVPINILRRSTDLPSIQGRTTTDNMHATTTKNCEDVTSSAAFEQRGI